VLNSGRRWTAALAALALTACSPTPQTPAGPIMVEAGYVLLFNDVLVGNALFALEIDPEGNYRIDAFTTPAGQMAQTDGHEVLESSHGVIAANGARPLRFDHSVMAGENIEVGSLEFDWDKHVLRLSSKQAEHGAALLPGTQDRLSYLLTARRLAMAGEGSAQITIASTESTEETRLQVAGKEAIDVPLGHYDSVAIRRVTPEPDVIRALWFDTDLSPLPLRVVHGWAGNTVDMQLESLSPRPPPATPTENR
jgi:hypothetical protein